MFKKLLLIGLLFLNIGCTKTKELELKCKEFESDNIALTNYVIELRDSLDYATKELDFWKTSFEDLQLERQNDANWKDSVEFLQEDLFIYKYKLERIKAYNSIVERDNSQNVFFRGWIKRVIEE